MYVRLLGEVAVGADESSLGRVPGSVPAAMLAQLALARGVVVTAAALEDALWDDPTAVSRNALQAAASRLRSRLEPGALEGSRAGYRLKGDVHVDLLEAEQLLATARRHLDAGALDDADAAAVRGLALFLGAAIAGVTAPMAEPVRRRADEVRSRLATLRAAALVASGRGEDAAALLRSELGRARLDDLLVEGLLDALVADGRATEAVQEYDLHRRALAAELGVDPSPAVQQAFARALDKDAAPAPPRRRRSLPAPDHPLVGRDADVAALASLVEDTDVRVVTVLGPGGMGKSQLALQVARTCGPGLAGGAWWVPLAPLTDPDLVVPTVALVLGVAEVPGEPTEVSIAQQVGDVATLLVLDNAEHLLDATAAAAQSLVTGCTGLSILVTSREPLRVGAEHRHLLAPLSDAAAVELLVARTVAAGSAVEPGPVATEICRRLDNLPLALELVAPRATAFTEQQLLDSLSAGLDALDERRAGEPRHRSLRSTIAWSTDLLDDDERRVFASLSALRGGFTLDLAHVVCAASPDTVRSLVDKSLVRRTTGRAGARFAMLETVREFAAELAAPRSEELARALAQHLGSTVRDLPDRNPLRLDDGAHAWIADERDNLRAARVWAAEHDPALLADLAAATWADLYFAGATTEAEAMLRRALAGCGDDVVRASLLNGLVLIVYRMDEPDEALSLAEQELAAAQRSTDATALVDAWRSVSIAHLVTGDDRAADEALATTIQIAQQSGDDWGVGSGLIGSANAAINRGELELGVEMLDDATAALAGSGGTYGRMLALSNKVEALLGLGRVDEALPILLEVYDDDWFEQRVWAVDSMSKVAWAQGLPRDALVLAAAATAGFDQIHQNREGMTAEVHAQLRTAARASLGDIEADAAEEEGRTLGLDAAHSRGHVLGTALTSAAQESTEP